MQQNRIGTFSITGMNIIRIQNGFLLVITYVHYSHVLCIIRRYQTIEISIEDNRFQPVIISNGFLAESQFICVQIFQTNIKAHFTHHGYIDTKLHRSILIPAGYMRTNSLRWEELREAPLNKQTFNRIGIITCPEFSKIFQSSIITASSTTRAEHHRHSRIFGTDTVQHLI